MTPRWSPSAKLGSPPVFFFFPVALSICACKGPPSLSLWFLQSRRFPACCLWNLRLPQTVWPSLSVSLVSPLALWPLNSHVAFLAPRGASISGDIRSTQCPQIRRSRIAKNYFFDVATHYRLWNLTDFMFCLVSELNWNDVILNTEITFYLYCF